MREGDRASRIPAGKEGKYLLLALALLAFWTYAAVADLLDGAIKMKGSSAEMTLSSNPFWFFVFRSVYRDYRNPDHQIYLRYHHRLFRPEMTLGALSHVGVTTFRHCEEPQATKQSRHGGTLDCRATFGRSQ